MRGTLQTDHKPFCLGCVNATVAHRARSNEYVVHCRQFNRVMPVDLDGCSGYMPFGKGEMGWQVQNINEFTVIDPRPRPERYL